MSEFKEKVTKKFEQVKDHVKKYKKRYVCLGTIFGSALVASHIFKNGHDSFKAQSNEIEKSSDNNTLDVSVESSKMMRGIDEDIFTDLAIRIENHVFDPELEQGFVEKTYSWLHFDKDIGEDVKVRRKVSVTIDDIDEE